MLGDTNYVEEILVFFVVAQNQYGNIIITRDDLTGKLKFCASMDCKMTSQKLSPVETTK